MPNPPARLFRSVTTRLRKKPFGEGIRYGKRLTNHRIRHRTLHSLTTSRLQRRGIFLQEVRGLFRMSGHRNQSFARQRSKCLPAMLSEICWSLSKSRKQVTLVADSYDDHRQLFCQSSSLDLPVFQPFCRRLAGGQHSRSRGTIRRNDVSNASETERTA